MEILLQIFSITALSSVLAASSPLIFASLGETLSERVGVINLSVEGTMMLGVKAVITTTYERIHRSNLIGMGVLPLNFKDAADYERLALDGSETYDIVGIDNNLKPMGEAKMIVHRADGSTDEATVVVRLDTPVEIDYYRSGGILPYVLAQIIRENA